MNSPKDRLMLYLKHKRMSLSDFSAQVNLNKAVVSRFGETTAPKSLLKIDENSDVNISWLLTGEGEMIKDGAISHSQSEESDLFSGVPKKFISHLVPIAAMGGSLIGFEEGGVSRERCERIVSPIADIDWVVPVCGDSMEPEYPNGSHVYVREVNHFDFIAWGHVYVLDTTNGIIIKVVEKSDEANCVRCVSLNPSGRYTPFDVPLRTIRRMYKVVLCASLK